MSFILVSYCASLLLLLWVAPVKSNTGDLQQQHPHQLQPQPPPLPQQGAPLPPQSEPHVQGAPPHMPSDESVVRRRQGPQGGPGMMGGGLVGDNYGPGPGPGPGGPPSPLGQGSPGQYGAMGGNAPFNDYGGTGGGFGGRSQPWSGGGYGAGVGYGSGGAYGPGAGGYGQGAYGASGPGGYSSPYSAGQAPGDRFSNYGGSGGYHSGGGGRFGAQQSPASFHQQPPAPFQPFNDAPPAGGGGWGPSYGGGGPASQFGGGYGGSPPMGGGGGSFGLSGGGYGPGPGSQNYPYADASPGQPSPLVGGGGGPSPYPYGGSHGAKPSPFMSHHHPQRFSSPGSGGGMPGVHRGGGYGGAGSMGVMGGGSPGGGNFMADDGPMGPPPFGPSPGMGAAGAGSWNRPGMMPPGMGAGPGGPGGPGFGFGANGPGGFNPFSQWKKRGANITANRNDTAQNVTGNLTTEVVMKSTTNGSEMEAFSVHPACPTCLPIDLSTFSGNWVQMFGNPHSLKRIFTTAFQHVLRPSVNNPFFDFGEESPVDHPQIKPICVGYELGQSAYSKNKLPLTILFREENRPINLLQVQGEISVENERLIMKFEGLTVPMCIAQKGSRKSENGTLLTFVNLVEVDGPMKCRSYHVFARSSEEFFRRNVGQVSAYFRNSRAKESFTILPHVEQCEYTEWRPHEEYRSKRAYQ